MLASVKWFVGLHVRIGGHMLFLFILLLLIVLFDVASLYWGFNSGEKAEGAEWERRRYWALSHPLHHD